MELKSGTTCRSHHYWYFPSRLIEAQPLTIIEAFACGTPVAAFKVGGIVDLIIDRQTGILVEPISSSAMLGAVDRLLASPGLLRAYGSQAASEFSRRFSHETYQRQWAKVLFAEGFRGNGELALGVEALAEQLLGQQL